MKNKNIYDALSGIDKKYIERSEDFEEIKAQFRRAKARKIGILCSFCSSLVITVCSVAVVNSNFFRTPPEILIGEVEVTPTKSTSTEKSTIITTKVSDKITTEKTNTATTVCKSDETTAIIEVTEPYIEENSDPDNIIDNPDDIPPVDVTPPPDEIVEPTDSSKGELPTEKPDDYDGIEEILVYDRKKYFSFYDDIEEYTLSEFIGTVEQFHAGDYYYLEPDFEVYTIAESSDFLVVKDQYDALFLFKTKEQL